MNSTTVARTMTNAMQRNLEILRTVGPVIRFNFTFTTEAGEVVRGLHMPTVRELVARGLVVQDSVSRGAGQAARFTVANES
jgi:hypothetical protein